MTQQQYEARQEALQVPTPTPLVVAFAGYSGVGKNTAADALLHAKPEEVGGRVFVSVAVADAIKDGPLPVEHTLGALAYRLERHRPKHAWIPPGWPPIVESRTVRRRPEDEPGYHRGRSRDRGIDI